MIIRAEQMQALGDSVLRAFENEMLAHLAQFSPPLFQAVKEDQLREAIRYGIKRAGEYGFTFRGPVRLYLELMLLFGSHFDTDPQYPWTATILADQGSAPEMQRAESLYEKTRDYRKNVAGPGDEYTLEALRRVAALAAQPLPVSAANFNRDMLQAMSEAYPQKVSFVGEDALKLLIGEGVAAAQGYGFSTLRSVALPVVLMFAFGHGCFRDPLYPWIGMTACDEMMAQPEARARRLEKKSVTWLEHVLANFAQSPQL